MGGAERAIERRVSRRVISALSSCSEAAPVIIYIAFQNSTSAYVFGHIYIVVPWTLLHL